MDIKTIAPDLSVSQQITLDDVGIIASRGFKTIIINRPDNEADDQPDQQKITDAATRQGLEVRYVPIIPGKMTDADVTAFQNAMNDLPAPALAYCRTGTRSVTLWALTQAGHMSVDAILKTTSDAGYDLSSLRSRLDVKGRADDPGIGSVKTYDIVVIGGGAAGLAAVASLRKRRKGLNIAIIEPSTDHYYQPGWTLIGGGIFKQARTEKQMARLMPRGVKWLRVACAGFDPARNQVILEDSERVGYKTLIVAPGLKLNWDGIEGLQETLGKNGVTSNYMHGLGAYTWQLVKSLRSGKALFTQPPMPIKCAGAPQKAMYLSCDAWLRNGILKNIDVSFHNSGGVLFGVSEYVPALMKYVEKYDIHLHFNETLVAVDGPGKTATFEIKDADGNVSKRDEGFDMLHVCPPQTSLDFVAASPLADDAGWVKVDSETLQHVTYANVFSLGDAAGTMNAKTAAAVRKQAPVVATNLLRVMDGQSLEAAYNGYGSCPLTVERGRVVLAEFAYGGKLDPTFPSWFLKGTKPTLLGWIAKAVLMPTLYFDFMLKGREWLARPAALSRRPMTQSDSGKDGGKGIPSKAA